MVVNLIYASLTGNTETLSELVVEKFREKDTDVELHFIEDMDDFSIVEESDAFIVASYTYDEGDIPSEMEEFFEELADMDLSGKIFGVIGTGDTIYEHFCSAVDQFDKRIKASGANNPTQNLKVEFEVDTEEEEENLEKFVKDFIAALN
ncbi:MULTISPECIES: flavodoxin domain-containing protein [unclassified Gemella]|uniref:flavodoxin domain-containing protein n=1 Tax=unclassified Gemella TaxID=2624949 RepID=UPI001073B2F7|nr:MULTISPECIES: flavodoxin domain-containing protein [unclassified Gemella]MBF0710243.1 flavodoxin domain-containing protein [Gemella sp. GL1.1]MBF0746329.1 flavodoxin domain-containing protein [Gemella sp. 19428wG2_WT2a]NYS27587.1 flavodoxin domain-containing protein [Gemella sp. GL1]TFU60605.1 flavodoxin [Gemella sp. WT2a]